MRTFTHVAAAAVAALFASSAPTAMADSFDTYSSLDFGSWCTEVAHYDQDRCVEARTDDQKAYNRYMDKTATYEAELMKKRDDDRVETDRVNRMGEVTPDTTRDRFEDNSMPDGPRW